MGWGKVKVPRQIDWALVHSRHYVVPDAVLQVTINLFSREDPERSWKVTDGGSVD